MELSNPKERVTSNWSSSNSNSKQVKIQPDVVEYTEESGGRPIFDLILLGTQTMDELGIILDF